MPVDFKFDHLVHYTNTPNEAIKILGGNGIHAVEGGIIKIAVRIMFLVILI